jgi:hypothetical protein
MADVPGGEHARDAALQQVRTAVGRSPLQVRAAEVGPGQDEPVLVAGNHEPGSPVYDVLPITLPAGQPGDRS